MRLTVQLDVDMESWAADNELIYPGGEVMKHFRDEVSLEIHEHLAAWNLGITYINVE